MTLTPDEIQFERIRDHVCHSVVAVTYGDPPINAAIECETCNEVLYSVDRPHQPRLTPSVMWQFVLVAGGVIQEQVIASDELEHAITELAIKKTAEALGIPMSELPGDQDDAWRYLVEATRDSGDIAVSLKQITVLQLGERTPSAADIKER